ncbi:MAG: helix-turn-helix transcriptional regulator [Telmatospirillum sp.]|nr:helix-turn-helix transcriptional regulator [Telmatospirillum sp.]
MTTIGSRLRAIRTALRETQRGMSKRFDLGINGWQDLERSNRIPKGETLGQLVAMGFSSDWLLTGVGSMHRPKGPPEKEGPDGREATPGSGGENREDQTIREHRTDDEGPARERSEEEGPDGRSSRRLAEIQRALQRGVLTADVKTGRDLGALIAAPGLSDSERALASAIFEATFPDIGRADGGGDGSPFDDVVRELKAATRLLETACKANEWTPPPAVWHSLQGLILRYSVRLGDIVMLLSALKPGVAAPPSVEASPAGGEDTLPA